MSVGVHMGSSRGDPFGAQASPVLRDIKVPSRGLYDRD